MSWEIAQGGREGTDSVFFGRLIVHNGGKALGVTVEEKENKENVVQACVLWRNTETGQATSKKK